MNHTKSIIHDYVEKINHIIAPWEKENVAQQEKDLLYNAQGICCKGRIGVV